jgi:hypothetical protein
MEQGEARGGTGGQRLGKPKRPYCAPEVRPLGSVKALTLSGGHSTIDNVTGATQKVGT